MIKHIPSLNVFWRMLCNHDWTFDYSDDHSVWRRGTAELSAIQEVVEAGGEEYKKLFEDYSAYAWRKDDSIKQPERPERSKEDRNIDREMFVSIADSLDLINSEIWSIEADQVTDATQLWKLYNPAKSIINKLNDLLEQKSKSSMWDTIAFKNYRKLKEDIGQ
jgi:hypothetical protein